MKTAQNAIFGTKKTDVAHVTDIPGTRVSQASYSAFVTAPGTIG